MRYTFNTRTEEEKRYADQVHLFTPEAEPPTPIHVLQVLSLLLPGTAIVKFVDFGERGTADAPSQSMQLNTREAQLSRLRPCGRIAGNLYTFSDCCIEDRVDELYALWEAGRSVERGAVAGGDGWAG